MPRPKPAEEYEKISVYAPSTLIERIKELAAASNGGNGIPVSTYVCSLLEEAAEHAAKIETISYQKIVRDSATTSRAADDRVSYPRDKRSTP